MAPTADPVARPDTRTGRAQRVDDIAVLDHAGGLDMIRIDKDGHSRGHRGGPESLTISDAASYKVGTDDAGVVYFLDRHAR